MYKHMHLQSHAPPPDGSEDLEEFTYEVSLHRLHSGIQVRILLYLFPCTHYICVLAPTIYVSSYSYVSLHRLHYGIQVCIILYMCPYTTTYVSAYYYVCVLILLCICPHTIICVSSYSYVSLHRLHSGIQARILLYVCPYTSIHVSSYYYTCVLILLHMCPHTTSRANRSSLR